jgi:chromosome segregation ATPase
MATETKQIEKQIADLQERRARVASEAATAHRELQSARRRHLSGEASASDVSTAQATHAALAGVVDEADGELGRLRARLAQAQATDAEQAKAARIEDLTALMERTQSEYDALRDEAGRSLAGFAEKVIDLRTTYTGASRAAARLRGGERTWDRHEMRHSPMPLGCSAALEAAAASLAHERERMSRKSRPPIQAPAHHVPLARVGDSAIQTGSADEAPIM